ARVHRALRHHRRSPAARPACHAPGPDQPRGRAHRRRRRLGGVARARAGAERARRPDGDPLRPPDRRPGRRRGCRGDGMTILAGPTGTDDVVVRGARVLDPVERVDGVLDVRVDRGVITEMGTDVDANGHRVIEAQGLVLAPAFVDPHVHLRTPGREDEETIESGTAAAAAGGYSAILAVPNTDPPVDEPDLL